MRAIVLSACLFSVGNVYGQVAQQVMRPVSFEEDRLTPLAIASAAAQTTVAQDLRKPNARLDHIQEEIVVTAQRRVERLQDVPIAVTALGEDRLEQLGADSFRGFALTVPGLQMNEIGANTAKFVIRGVSTEPFIGGNLQDTVVSYIDDLPTGDSRSNITIPDISLFDVERVEVLRGPQGTLFGSGAMGGAIRIVTNQPDAADFAAKFEANFDGTKGGDLSQAYKGMVNVPLVDEKLALRVVGYYRNAGGWMDNLGVAGVTGSFSGENANDLEAYGGRVMLRYQPSERWDLLAKFAWDRSTPEDSPYYTSIANGVRVRQRAVPDYSFEKSDITNLVIKYDFGWSAVRSSTTYYERKSGTQGDWTFLSAFLLPSPVASPSVDYVPSKSLFEEITWSSNDAGRMHWLIGAFYRDQDPRDYRFKVTVPGSEALLGSGVNGAPDDVVFTYRALYKTTEKALFGQFSYRLTEQLEATVGARYFTHSIDQNALSSGGLFYPSGPVAQVLGMDDSADNYKFSLSYKVTGASMIYATAAQGYRVGAPNVPPTDPTIPVPSKYGPDSLWNYELGAKTSWFADRLILNGAVYYIDWSDMQMATVLGTNGYIDNVGKAHSQGVELEISIKELPGGIDYRGAASYTDARLDVNNPTLDASDGDRVPAVPKWAFSNLIEKRFPVAGLDGFIQFNHQFVGESFSMFNRFAANSAPMGDYHLVGVRMGLDVSNWEVVLYVDNALDDDSSVAAMQGLEETRHYPLRPRTVGLVVRTAF